MRQHPPPSKASSSFSDGAFECDSPAALMSSQLTLPDAGSTEGFERADDAASSSQSRSQSHTNSQSHNQSSSSGNGSGTLPPHHHHHHPQQTLVSQSVDSQDLEDGIVEYGELAQPHAEIVLRWKRFALLVLMAAVAISGATAMLVAGIPITEVKASEAEKRVDDINSFSGIVMGFFESFLGLLLGELLPVFIVYLHNLKWFPGDDPATKVSKFKKIALMLFIPLVMVALGNSFSAVQANQSTTVDNDRRMRARHLQQQQQHPISSGHITHSFAAGRALLAADVSVNEAVVPLEETILSSALSRRLLPAPPLSASSCAVSESLSGTSDKFGALLQSLPAATFGFPTRSWSNVVYPDPASWKRTRTTTLTPDSVVAPETLAVPLSTALELMAQGCRQLTSLAYGDADFASNPNDAPDVRETNLSNLLLEITRRLQNLNLGPLEYDAIDVSLQRSPLSSLIQLDAMTITIPVKTASDEEHTVACGSESCVLLEEDSASSLRQLPRKQISVARYCTGGQGGERTCRHEDNAAFLFGFTTTTRITRSPEQTPQHSLVFSFGKLSWKLDDFRSMCVVEEASAVDCHVLHHPLASGSQHLVLGAKFLARRLSVRPTRLVQVVERKAQIGNARARISDLGDRNQLSPASSPESCSAAVDSYQQYVVKNYLLLDRHMVQSMYTSALLYLFQDAAVVENVEVGDTVKEAIARRLLDAQSSPDDQYVEIYISNTDVGQISTWVGCVALLVLSTLVIVLPNERARLEPPKGGNARAERFISVQTEEVYPNFVYKKRFLIGKTGEEIKFSEFAVESVSLHHKMEVDEQIYL